MELFSKSKSKRKIWNSTNIWKLNTFLNYSRVKEEITGKLEKCCDPNCNEIPTYPDVQGQRTAPEQQGGECLGPAPPLKPSSCRKLSESTFSELFLDSNLNLLQSGQCLMKKGAVNFVT